MSVTFYPCKGDALQDVAQSYCRDVGPVRHMGEDGPMHPVFQTRAFTLEGQSECGYMGELREPFQREAVVMMLASATDDEWTDE